MALALGLAAALAACARPAQPPTAADKPAASASKAAPTDLSPNVERDRRLEPGLRHPAKPLVLGKPRSAKCGKLGSGPLDAASADLLGGRLKVRVPAMRDSDGAADAPPVHEESRVVFERDAGRAGKPDVQAFAIVARETFQLDPDRYQVEGPAKPEALDVEAKKFLQATYRDAGPMDVTPVEIAAPDGAKMRAYAARPRAPNAPPGKDTALVLGLLVAHPDGTLQSVGFFVRGEIVRTATGSDLVGCTRLAERIAATLAPGPREIDRSAGPRHVATASGEQSLAVRVPSDYVVVEAEGGARLTKLRPLSMYAGSIAIALGSGAAKEPEGAEATVPGTLFGKPAAWRGKTSPKGGFLFVSAPLPEDATRNVEVLLKANRDTTMLDEFRGVAETLEVVPRSTFAEK